MSSTNPTSSIPGGISSLGVGSGLDLNGVIDKLIKIESIPIKQYEDKKKTNDTKLSTLGEIQSDLFTLQTSLYSLKNAGSSELYTATSSNSSSVSATATSDAAEGTYTLNVTNLAQAQSIAATGQVSPTAAIGGGAPTTVTISFGTISGGVLAAGIYTGATFTPNTNEAAITVTINNSNNTLLSIRDEINNSTANEGRVLASIVNDGSGTPYRLTLTSMTGVDNSLNISVAGDPAIDALLAYDPSATQNMTQQQTAQSASFTVNGLAVTSSSNTVTDVATGITFNLLTPASSATISITRDNSDITDAVTEFVAAYNDVATKIKDSIAYQALMQGDASLRILSMQLTSGIFALKSNGNTGYNSFSDLGIKFSNGKLVVDESTLAEAIAANPTQVKTVIGSYGVDLGATVFSALGSSGLISSSIAALHKDNDDLDIRIDKLNDRITISETNLRKQFAALDTLISSLQRTSSYLTQQFDSIAANSNSSNK